MAQMVITSMQIGKDPMDMVAMSTRRTTIINKMVVTKCRIIIQTTKTSLMVTMAQMAAATTM
jgi:hypothetical protein